MKKLLAFLLAVTMIATLIPSAFADGGEGRWTIECDLEKLTVDLGMYGANPAPLSALSYANTGEAFRYIRSSQTSPDQPIDEVADDTTANNKIKFPGAQPGSNAGFDTKGFIALYKGNYICFEVNVPKDGNYTLKLNHKLSATSTAALLKVYMTDADTFYKKGLPVTTAHYGTNEATINTGDSSLTVNAESIANANWDPDKEIFTDRKLTAGKYIITYSIESGSNSARAAIGNFSLEGTPIEEEPEEPAEPETKKAIIYNVPQIMKDNGIHYGKGLLATTMTYEMTNGLFEVIDARGSITIGGAESTLHNYLKLAKNATVDFKVNVPEAGTYFLNVNHQLTTIGGTVLLYFRCVLA